HQERLFEDVRCAADSYLLLLHRLEQRGLDFCRCAIDFIGENDVGEYRPLLYRESSVRLVVDLSPDDIRWQQIGGELNAAERSVDRFSHGSNCESFCEAGNTFQQYVAPSEQANHQPLDHVILTDDAAAYLMNDLMDDACISGCNGLCAHVLFLA